MSGISSEAAAKMFAPVLGSMNENEERAELLSQVIARRAALGIERDRIAAEDKALLEIELGIGDEIKAENAEIAGDMAKVKAALQSALGFPTREALGEEKADAEIDKRLAEKKAAREEMDA